MPRTLLFKRIKQGSIWLVFIALAFITAGCAPVIRLEGVVHTGFISLEAGKTAGQSFLARFNGLEGFSIYLKPGEAGSGNLFARLYKSPLEPEVLASSQISLSEINVPGYYRFEWPAIKPSFNQDYYFDLKVDGPGSVLLGYSNENTYLNGALYQNGQPVGFQAGFQLLYQPGLLLAGLASEGLQWAGWLLIAAVLLVIPGWGMLSLLPSWKECHWGEKVGLSVGLSLALYPLLFLWVDLVGLHPGRYFAWLPPLAGLAIWMYGNFLSSGKARQAVRKESAFVNRPVLFGFPKLNFPDLVLLILIVLLFATRFWAIRNLDAPLWGDSYQHAVISQLLVDHGGLFQSWEPYAPYQTFTVHYGFSAITALFMWFTGLAAPAATMLAGQVLNGLAVLALFPLALRLSGGSLWAGIGTVLFAGLLSPQPAYLVNWGRYAQLSGLAVLPVALCLLWDVLAKDEPEGLNPDNGARRGRFFSRNSLLMMFFAGLALAGMTLHYYRMPFFYGTFAPAFFIVWGLPNWQRSLSAWIHAVLNSLVIAGFGLFLFIPWITRLGNGELVSAVGAGVANAAPLTELLADFQLWREITLFGSPVLFLFGLGGFAVAVFRRRWMVASLVLWYLVLFAYVAGKVIRLPGANMMQNFTILLGIYIPLSLLAGYLTGQIASLFGLSTVQSSDSIDSPSDGEDHGRLSSLRSNSRTQAASRYLFVVLILVMACWGAYQQRGVLKPGTFSLVMQPDMKAMQWIRQNTTSQDRFLVEGYRIYDGASIVGSDAGWWIPLLSGRSNTIPPQYAILNERPDPADYTQRMVDLVATLENNPPASPEGLRRLCQEGITYAYIGQSHGEVGYGATQLFSAEELERSAAFRQVYGQDRVQIFAFDRNVCGGFQ